MKSNPLNRGPAFLGDLLDSLTERTRRLLGWRDGPAGRDKIDAPDLSELAESLLSRRGEASGVVLAQALLAAFEAADGAAKLAFLKALAERFGPEPKAVKTALAALQKSPEAPELVEAIHLAAEPRRQEVMRRLNLAPGGTAGLVKMREELLAMSRANPELRRVDSDFAHLFGSWFNRGFLGLRLIDWHTPASILEKIIRYEAVHAIQNWDDLRNRLQPTDRRCYGFFHPQLVDEPLIFVEVALTSAIPDNVAELLDLSRAPIAAEEATTAVFYSISNTQKGLAGVSFGNFLIKQVVAELKAQLPNIRCFVTLSPVPGFAAWLSAQRKDESSTLISAAQRRAFAVLDQPEWHKDPALCGALKEPLLAAAATYFLKAKDKSHRLPDPVARFHLGNGACLERLNYLGDVSANGMKQSHGLMVNYLYDLAKIETNHEAFVERAHVAVSDSVKAVLPTAGAPQKA